MIYLMKINSFVKNYHNWNMQLILFSVVLISSMIRVRSSTIQQIPVIAFMLFVIFLDGFLKGKRIYLLIGLSVTMLVSLFANGVLVMKDVFLWFFPYIAIYYVVSRGGFNYRYLYLFVSLTLVWYLLKNPDTVTYLPNKMMINVYGEGTKHGTAKLGIILFTTAFYIMYLRWRLSMDIKYTDIICLLFGGYLIFFSSSRSAILSVLASIILLFVNLNGLKKWRTWILFWLFNLSTYFLEILTAYSDYIRKYPLVSELVHVDNFEKSYGVTSGRSWLWGYHIDTFLKHPIFGGGRKYVDFSVNDYIPDLGIIAKAGSESPFTGMLASNGLIGVLQIAFVVYLFHKAVKAKNVMGTVIMFCCIYNTTMGINFLDNRSECVLMIALYYMSFYDNRLLVYPSALLKKLKDFKKKLSLRATYSS